MSYQFLSELSTAEFDAFAAAHPLKNIFQSSKWAQIKKEWLPLFTGVRENDKLVAASLVLVRKLPLGFTLFYLPRGPLLDYHDQEVLNYYFQQLKILARKKRALSIKIDPNILLASTPYKEIEHAHYQNTDIIENLKKLGFRHFGFNKDMYSASQPRYTACLYYEDELNEQLKKTASYKKYQRAVRYGVYTEEIGVSQLDDFCRLMQMTEDRKNVSLRNKEYYTRLLQVYQDDAYILISKLNLRQHLTDSTNEKETIQKQLNSIENQGKQAKNLENQLLALDKEIERTQQYLQEEGEIINISCSLAITDHYNCELLYAGMDERYKRYLATYYSNYKRLQWGKEKGCTKCNFGGVPGTLDDGLTEFKTAFGVNIDEFIGEFDLPLNKVFYPLFEKLLPFVKKSFKLLARRRRTS